MKREKRKPVEEIDLHPSDWDHDWQPPIGNDLLPGEKPHIWQEFKRDLHMRRNPGERIAGRGWPILVFILIVIAVQAYYAAKPGSEWLIAVKNLF